MNPAQNHQIVAFVVGLDALEARVEDAEATAIDELKDLSRVW